MKNRIDERIRRVLLFTHTHTMQEKALFMDTSFIKYIEKERRKIDFLQSKIEECHQRIAALQSLSKSDDLDDIIFKGLEEESTQSAEVSSEGFRSAHDEKESDFVLPKRHLQEAVVDQLMFIGRDGKSLDEIEKYAVEKKNYHNGRDRLRTFLSGYKIRYGFLENYNQGFYRITQRCYNFLLKNGYLEKYAKYQQNAIADAMVEDEGLTESKSANPSINAPEPGRHT